MDRVVDASFSLSFLRSFVFLPPPIRQKASLSLSPRWFRRLLVSGSFLFFFPFLLGAKRSSFFPVARFIFPLRRRMAPFVIWFIFVSFFSLTPPSPRQFSLFFFRCLFLSHPSWVTQIPQRLLFSHLRRQGPPLKDPASDPYSPFPCCCVLQVDVFPSPLTRFCVVSPP